MKPRKRIGANGKVSWLADVRVGRNGRLGHSSKTFKTKAEATAFIHSETTRLKALAEQGVAEANNPQELPLTYFIHRRMYEKITNPIDNNGGGYTDQQYESQEYMNEQRFAWLSDNTHRLCQEQLFQQPIYTITPDSLQHYFRQLTYTLKASSIGRNYWSELNCAFQIALRDGVIQSNPLADLTKGRKRSSIIGIKRIEKPPRVSETDIQALIDNSNNPLYRYAITILVETGLRRAEFLRLKWRYLNDRVLEIPGYDNSKRITKSGKPRNVALTQIAYTAIQKLYDIDYEAIVENNEPMTANIERQMFLDSRIMPVSLEAFKSQWRRTNDKAGLDINVHRLRHEAVYRLLTDYKLSPNEVADITGHTTTQIFNHYAGGSTKASLDKLWSNTKS